MVVDTNAISGGGLESHSALTKNLESSAHDHSRPIFNYVHLSTNVLRKVRFGQPLDTALHDHPLQPSLQSRQQTNSTTDLSIFPLSLPKSSRSPAPAKSGLYRDIESSTDARRPLSLPQRLAPNHKLAGGNSALPCIRYGRTVRFQADDGGYLLMERDGILRKAPPEFRNDPRTVLTLFPMDPRLSTSKKRVRRDDCVFVVQGAAPMYSRHGAVYANSQRLMHLAASIRGPNDSTESLLPPHASTTPHDATQIAQEPNLRHSLRRKHIVAEALPTTVWRMKKPIAADSSTPSPPRASAPTKDEDHFRSGGTIILVQNDAELSYELQALETPIPAASTRSYTANSTEITAPFGTLPLEPTQLVGEDSALCPEAEATSSSDNQTVAMKKPLFGAVWLRRSSAGASATIHRSLGSVCSSSWAICDIGLEKQRELQQLQRLRRFQACATLDTIAGLSKAIPSASTENGLNQKARLLVPTVLRKPPVQLLAVTRPLGPVEQLAVPEQIDQSQNDTDTSLERGPRSLVATAGVRQHHAARIIARFLQNTRRYDSAPDRAREFLRRRWRERNPERYRSRLLELTNDQQLRVLQLYNPHLYGSRLSIPPLATAAATSVRLSQTPHMEQTQRLMQQQRQARVDQATALLKESCEQKTQTPLSATVTLHEMYKRRPFTSPDRSRHLHGHEGAHCAHVRVARSSPPSFHYGTLAQVRPQLPRSAMGLPRQERGKGSTSVTFTRDHNA